MNKQLIKSSKLLSLVLRHKPEEIGIELDVNGWVNVALLIHKMKEYGHHITLDMLNELVETNDKKRFAFNTLRTEIRASQGHSIKIDLALPSQIPPQFLYHGTASQNVGPIFKLGIQSGKRNHVHLSTNMDTAFNVGSRHGKAVVLEVESMKMHEAGHQFYLSDNGVWLTDSVPPKFVYIKNYQHDI